MTYSAEFKRSAMRQLKRLPKNIQRRVAHAVDRLAENPRPHGYIQWKPTTFFTASASVTIA